MIDESDETLVQRMKETKGLPNASDALRLRAILHREAMNRIRERIRQAKP